MQSDASDADSIAETEHPKKRLKVVDLSLEVADGDVSNATQLVIKNRGYTDIDSLELCRSLKKLELQDNKLTNLAFVEMNHQLCWLTLAKNLVRRISSLDNLVTLAVLDLSDNRLTKMEGLSGLTGLKTLILARNRISCFEGLSTKKNAALETVILSHNRLAECRVAVFPNLKKLSLGNNLFHKFPDLAKLPALSELRLNGNKILAFPSSIKFLPSITLVDVGNNLISALQSIEPLKDLHWLKSLNMMGNAVESDKDFSVFVHALPKLEILNNQRLDGKRKKRQGIDFGTPQDAEQSWQTPRTDRGGGRGGGGEGRGRGRGEGRGSTSSGRGMDSGPDFGGRGEATGASGRGRGSWETDTRSTTASIAYQGKRAVFEDSDDEALDKAEVSKIKVAKRKKRKCTEESGMQPADVQSEKKGKKKIRGGDSSPAASSVTRKKKRIKSS